jgi:2-phosphoglycerate kinase
MATLYLLGGSARSGKTIIANQVVRRKPMWAIASDALRASWRKVIVGESYINVDQLDLRGTTVFRRPGSLKPHKRAIRRSLSEQDLTWKAVVGLIEHMDRKNKDVFIEGIALTPQRVHSLRLHHLSLRAAFVGFTREDHLAQILRYAHRHQDWIHASIKEHGSDAYARHWFNENLQRNLETKKQCQRYGYRFFDVSQPPFKKFVQKVSRYLVP